MRSDKGLSFGLLVFVLIAAAASSAALAGADRTLAPCYSPGLTMAVSLAVTPPASAQVYALEETPPGAWVVSEIAQGGVWDATNRKVKWGPFFDNTPRTLTYKATPSAADTGTKSFAGTLSVDGVNTPVSGASEVSPCAVETVSVPLKPAGPAAGVINQSYAYTTGGASTSQGHPVEYQYEWDGTVDAWGAASTRSHTWATAGSKSVRARARCATHPAVESAWSDGLSVTIASPTPSHAERALGSCYSPSAAMLVPIAVTPRATAHAYAVEDGPPGTWAVSEIGQSGVWDATNRKVKWGPFFDNTPRTLTYKATPSAADTGTKSFAGTLSVDGVNTPVSGASEVSPCAVETVSVPLKPAGPAAGVINQSYAYTTGGASSSQSHPVEYQYEWDGTVDAWAAASMRSHTWATAGSKSVRARARCATHPAVESAWSDGLSVTVASPMPSHAERTLGSCYSPNATILVSVAVTPSVTAQAHAVEEGPPGTWLVSEIGQAGVWDATNRKVKWGPFFDSSPRVLTYRVTPPASATGDAWFSGVLSVDGVNSPIEGAAQMSPCAGVSPEEGTVGSTVTIRGAGFGSRAGKATLKRGTASAKCRVRSWTDTTVVCSVSDSPAPRAGVYDVLVSASARVSTTFRAAFSIVAPMIEAVDADREFPPVRLEIRGQYFGEGSRRQKVWLEYQDKGKSRKRALAPVAWLMDSIQVAFPTNLPEGARSFELVVSNAVGSARATLPIQPTVP